MRLDTTTARRAPVGRRSILARVGTIGFLFFLFKGVLWLALPTWLYITR